MPCDRHLIADVVCDIMTEAYDMMKLRQTGLDGFYRLTAVSIADLEEMFRVHKLACGNIHVSNASYIADLLNQAISLNEYLGATKRDGRVLKDLRYAVEARIQSTMSNLEHMVTLIKGPNVVSMLPSEMLHYINDELLPKLAFISARTVLRYAKRLENEVERLRLIAPDHAWAK